MNRLATEASPYLRQHANNPVDWFPWGEEAFALARSQNKVVFVSIGYSTCHWCHVMAHHCFENTAVAELLNTSFICIKIDRQERPDLDEFFMDVCIKLTGSGGWPLSIFLTPDRQPFFAGTYIPAASTNGQIGLLELLPRISQLWKDRHLDILHTAAIVGTTLAEETAPSQKPQFSENTLRRSLAVLTRDFDEEHGGFGYQPKFPMPSLIYFLLRAATLDPGKSALAMAERTLVAMRAGGIFDQLGYGFHRYATDAAWLVPHFEKMLYDQALLALAYTEAWQTTGRGLYRQSAQAIFQYFGGDLLSPSGGYYSAEDADSGGEEGGFYIWRDSEIRELLSPAEYQLAARYFGLHPGANILHCQPDLLENPPPARAKLLSARKGRSRPFLDDQILTDWNGLAIAALARAGAAFNDPGLVAAAGRTADFLLHDLRSPDGDLQHRWHQGRAAIGAFAHDYAFLAWGLLELHQADLDPRWLQACIEMTDELVRNFWDAERGALFSSHDSDSVFQGQHKMDFDDGVIPSANSVAFLVLEKLARMTGRLHYRELADSLQQAFPPAVAEHPLVFGFFLSALQYALGPTFEVIIAGSSTDPSVAAFVSALHSRFLPNVVALFRPTDQPSPAILDIIPDLVEYQAPTGKTTAYVCIDRKCRLPVTEVADMMAQLSPPQSFNRHAPSAQNARW